VRRVRSKVGDDADVAKVNVPRLLAGVGIETVGDRMTFEFV
jgi:hypothetical protein